jgi:two-component system, LuxR family, sensor kinase FixL
VIEALPFALGLAALAAVVGLIAARRRLAEQAAEIVEANGRLEALFGQPAVGVAYVGLDGRWLRLNDRFCEIAGHERATLMGLSIDDITHPDDLADDVADRENLRSRRVDRTSTEKRYVRGDGRIVWVKVTRSRVGGVAERADYIVAVVEEISARKEAESQLTSGEAQYRAIFDSAVEAMAVIDAEGTIQSINPSVERVFGYSSAELAGVNIKLLMPASIGSRHDSYLGRYRDTGQRAIIGIGREVIGQRKDGSVFPLDLSVAEWTRDGQTFFTGVMRDVSARKDAEAALIAQEAQYRAIFDSAVEAMAVIDAEGTIQSINPSVELTFGYSSAELAGVNIKLLMPDSIGSQHDSYLGRYRDTGKRAIIGIGREVIGQRKDGSVFPLDLSVAEWTRDGQTFFTGVMRDISARKDAETALRASEGRLRLLQNEFAHLARVNDLGEMAAAIAHEINQPLTAIANFLNAGLSEPGDAEADSEIQELLSLASAQALRAGEIVRRLREFVGQGNGERRAERAQGLTDSAMAMALIDARLSGISVERIADAGDTEVLVDAVQIQQVLVNLLRNAVDALGSEDPDGRRITVTTRRGPRKSIQFIVADNGPGIAPDLRDRLFDPFVTTKAKGMGMGLSVCRRLIEAHGGTLGVKSGAGKGASFIFDLPRAGQAGATHA